MASTAAGRRLDVDAIESDAVILEGVSIAVFGREYRSADYDTARNRVDLTALSAAGSIRII